MNRLVTVFSVLAAIGLAVTIWLIFTFVPNDRSLFFNYRIFYWHVPHGFVLFTATTICGVASAMFLWKRDPRWDDVALASAEIAIVFGAVVLATGMIWAKAAWDVWWSWEKRLTMSLLLWLVLVGYVIVRRFAGASGDRLAAGLAVFGTAGIPFIYFMVDKSDHHPQAGANGNVATLTGDMKLVFWASVATFLCWFGALLASRVASARDERQLIELRERGLDAGLLT